MRYIILIRDFIGLGVIITLKGFVISIIIRLLKHITIVLVVIIIIVIVKMMAIWVTMIKILMIIIINI